GYLPYQFIELLLQVNAVLRKSRWQVYHCLEQGAQENKIISGEIPVERRPCIVPAVYRYSGMILQVTGYVVIRVPHKLIHDLFRCTERRVNEIKHIVCY